VIASAGQQALGIQFSHNHPVSWRTPPVLADKVKQYLNHSLVMI
jgi:hypothetical protein